MRICSTTALCTLPLHTNTLSFIKLYFHVYLWRMFLLNRGFLFVLCINAGWDVLCINAGGAGWDSIISNITTLHLSSLHFLLLVTTSFSKNILLGTLHTSPPSFPFGGFLGLYDKHIVLLSSI